MATASSFPVSKSLVRPASYYLGEIESKYPAITQAISEFPWLANGIETIEDFMGPPWVKTDVILYLEPDFPAVSDLFEAGFNAGTHIVIKTDPAAPGFNGTLYHELAHYYFHGRNFPEWLREGAADLLESYTLHFSENASLRSRYTVAQPRQLARVLGSQQPVVRDYPSGVGHTLQSAPVKPLRQ